MRAAQRGPFSEGHVLSWQPPPQSLGKGNKLTTWGSLSGLHALQRSVAMPWHGGAKESIKMSVLRGEGVVANLERTTFMSFTSMPLPVGTCIVVWGFLTSGAS